MVTALSEAMEKRWLRLILALFVLLGATYALPGTILKIRRCCTMASSFIAQFK